MRTYKHINRGRERERGGGDDGDEQTASPPPPFPYCPCPSIHPLERKRRERSEGDEAGAEAGSRNAGAGAWAGAGGVRAEGKAPQLLRSGGRRGITTGPFQTRRRRSSHGSRPGEVISSEECGDSSRVLGAGSPGRPVRWRSFGGVPSRWLSSGPGFVPRPASALARCKDSAVPSVLQ